MGGGSGCRAERLVGLPVNLHKWSFSLLLAAWRPDPEICQGLLARPLVAAQHRLVLPGSPHLRGSRTQVVTTRMRTRSTSCVGGCLCTSRVESEQSIMGEGVVRGTASRTTTQASGHARHAGRRTGGARRCHARAGSIRRRGKCAAHMMECDTWVPQAWAPRARRRAAGAGHACEQARCEGGAGAGLASSSRRRGEHRQKTEAGSHMMECDTWVCTRASPRTTTRGRARARAGGSRARARGAHGGVAPSRTDGYARAAADLVVCLGSLLAFSCAVVWYQVQHVARPRWENRWESVGIRGNV